MVELDAPFEEVAERHQLRVVIERELGKDDLAAPERLGDVGRVPPELLDERAVLGFRRLRRDMGSVGRRRPIRCSSILVEENAVADVEGVRQGLGSRDPLDERVRPDGVIDLDAVGVDHAEEVLGDSVQLALVPPARERLSIRRHPAVVGDERGGVADGHDQVVVGEEVDGVVGSCPRAREDERANLGVRLAPGHEPLENLALGRQSEHQVAADCRKAAHSSLPCSFQSSILARVASRKSSTGSGSSA